MIDTTDIVLVTLMVAGTVFAVRASGFVLAARLDGERARRVLDNLPGAAIAAVVAPAVFRGNPTELVIAGITAAVFMLTGRMTLSVVIGVTLLIVSAHLGYLGGA